MISEELKVIVGEFKEQGKMNFLVETTEDKISEFEKEHSIKFPAKFKEWLLFSDGGELFCQLEFNCMALNISQLLM